MVVGRLSPKLDRDSEVVVAEGRYRPLVVLWSYLQGYRKRWTGFETAIT